MEENKDLQIDNESVSAANAEAAAETVTADASQAPEAKKKKRKKPGFFSGLITGIVLCVLAAFFYRGYIAFPMGKKGTFIIRFPYYNTLHGKKDSKIDKIELNRKVDEIENLVNNSYMYDLNTQDEMDGMFTGMLYGLTNDNYSQYWSKEAFSQELKSIEGSYVGIGVSVAKDDKTGGILVGSVAADGPAKEAGIMAGDLIIEANGESLLALDINECVEKITGPEGTEVTVKVNRDGQLIDFTMVRKKIIDITVRGKLMDDGRTGYLSITGFNETTETEFYEVYDELTQNKEAKGIIIDLRNNPGGDMLVTLRMLDSLLPDDLTEVATEIEELPAGTKKIATGKEDSTLLLSVEDKEGNYVEYRAYDGMSDKTPIVVLVNEHSASASEIFSGVLQSYGCKVVGTKTFGKGIVQSVYTLRDKSAVKFTTDQYRLPNGKLIHGVGIEPDVAAEFTEFDDITAFMVNYANGDEVDLEKDAQVKAAQSVIMDAIESK